MATAARNCSTGMIGSAGVGVAGATLGAGISVSGVVMSGCRGRESACSNGRTGTAGGHVQLPWAQCIGSEPWLVPVAPGIWLEFITASTA